MTTLISARPPVRGIPAGLPGLLRSEARLMRRNPALVVWVTVLPVIAAVVVGAIPGTRRPSSDLNGQSWFGLYQPILVMFAMVSVSVQILPDVLTRYREMGILRRLRTTPASPSALLAAQMILTFAVELVVMVVMVLAPAAAGAPLPGNIIGFLIAFVFSALCMLAIGLVLASAFRSNKVAGAAGTLLFFALQFFAGLWIPRTSMPDWMRTISDVTPSGAAVRALTDAGAGHWPPFAALGVLVAWTVVLAAFSVRVFRWE